MAQIDNIYRTRGGPVADGVREPRRQKAVRRPAVQLQQTRQTRSEHQRRSPGVHKTKTVAAHRCGE